jgi:diguanylate cyclase (GGDEF)-like protein
VIGEGSYIADLAQAGTLLRALMQTRFTMKNGLKLSVSASIGVASVPADGSTLHAIIGAADARMYTVKTNGRGAVKGA